MEQLRVGSSGQRMQISYKEHIIVHIAILHAHKLAQCAEIIAQMQISRGAYATKHYFLTFFFHNQYLKSVTYHTV